MPSSANSSRHDARATGLDSTERGSWEALRPPPAVRPRALSWLNPRVLLHSRNEYVAHLYDRVPELRQAWMAGQPDPRVPLDLADFTFLLLGDTGEGDNSQYALLPTVQQRLADAAFVFICSDLIYPGGDVNDYHYKFYFPYQDSHLPKPIYAIPGNHDWYDGLAGFMYHFCPETTAGPVEAPPVGPLGVVRRVLGRLLWRRPPTPDPAEIATMQALRTQFQRPLPQPGPYFMIDTEHVQFIGIDPGIVGGLDARQAEWLVRVSAESAKPKVLLSGKPLLVDGHTDPCRFPTPVQGFADVLDVVHEERFGYVAVIGGDVHNYQHYPVALGDRVIHHVVSGGGGAFMHATHTIDPIDPERVLGVTEDAFRCYPLRRDSLAVYSRVIHNRVHDPKRRHGPCQRWCRNLEVTPDQAAIYLRDRHGIAISSTNRPVITQPAETTVADLPRHVRRMCAFLVRIGGGSLFHKLFSPFLDWDDPPFFKNFLEITVDGQGLTIQCYEVTGNREQEDDPRTNDAFTVPWPTKSEGSQPQTTEILH